MGTETWSSPAMALPTRFVKAKSISLRLPNDEGPAVLVMAHYDGAINDLEVWRFTPPDTWERTGTFLSRQIGNTAQTALLYDG